MTGTADACNPTTAETADRVVRLPATALLLDMDGVLVDSTGTVEAHWLRWAIRRDVEPSAVLAVAHGAPAHEVIAQFVQPEDVATETAWMERLALEPADEMPLPGALAVLRQQVLPVAVVTSAPRSVALFRLQRAGLPLPAELVTADDVKYGKPDPEAYQQAASALGVDPKACVAVEDSPTGLAAVCAAGARPLALLTTHRASELGMATYLLPNLEALRVETAGVFLDRDLLVVP